MIGVSIWRVFKTALQNFGRNIWLSLATTIVMVITLLMMSFLFFANIFGARVLHDIEKKVDLSATFKEKVSDEYIIALAKEMESRDDVESVRIVTSQQALEDFRRRHKDEPFYEESLKELQDNPLPASMFLVATEPRFYEKIAKQLAAEKYSPYLERVNYENTRPVIEKLIWYITTIQEISLIITVGFALLVVLIMFNTIRLAIYSFREEIDIMRLVGASRWYIQGPFLLEAVLVAVLAVAITTSLLYPALKAAATPLERFFFEQTSEPFNLYQYAILHWKKIMGIQILSAVGLAVVSSLIGIRRYLRN